MSRFRISGDNYYAIATCSPGLKGGSRGNSEHIIFGAAETSSLLDYLLSEPANKVWKLAGRPGLHNEGLGNGPGPRACQDRQLRGRCPGMKGWPVEVSLAG